MIENQLAQRPFYQSVWAQRPANEPLQMEWVNELALAGDHIGLINVFARETDEGWLSLT